MSERRYPTVSRSEMDRLAAALLEGELPVMGNSVTWQQSDDDIDFAGILNFSDKLLAKLEEVKDGGLPIDKDAFEGRASGKLHAATKGLPMQVLDDPGFWRYLSLHLWDFVSWREQLTEKNIRTYMDGTRSSECVPLRMFLRGQAAGRDGDYGLAGAIPDGTDFWRSHVLRVRTGAFPPVAQAFAEMQRDERMTTLPLRSFARRVNRVGSNVVLSLYDDDESRELLKELRAAQDSEPVLEVVAEHA